MGISSILLVLLLRQLFPPLVLYILPILLMAAILLLGGQLPRDIMRRGRARRPGVIGISLMLAILTCSGFLLTPVYGPWGLILTALLGLAIWKRFYYIGSKKVDTLWMRG
jgi:hypothetical protein